MQTVSVLEWWGHGEVHSSHDGPSSRGPGTAPSRERQAQEGEGRGGGGNTQSLLTASIEKAGKRVINTTEIRNQKLVKAGNGVAGRRNERGTADL